MEAELREDAHSGDRIALAPARDARPGGRRTREDVLVRPRRPAEECPFCAGREAETPPASLALPADGAWRARAFPNRFPALPEAAGLQEVIVHGGAHVLRLAELDPALLVDIGAAWAARIRALRALGVPWVVPLVNEGAASGSSLDHSHSQVIATREPPPRLAREVARAADGRDVLDDCGPALTVHEDEALVAFAPRASRSSYELRIARRDATADAAGEPALLARAVGLAAHLLDAAVGPVALSLWLHHAPPGTAGPRWHVEALPRLGVLGGMELGVGLLICQTAPEVAAEAYRAAAPAVVEALRPAW